eukprot:30850-Pelagococcus_subviridis.AAC.40
MDASIRFDSFLIATRIARLRLLARFASKVRLQDDQTLRALLGSAVRDEPARATRSLALGGIHRVDLRSQLPRLRVRQRRLRGEPAANEHGL